MALSVDPRLFFGCQTTVQEAWIDYNGHMNVGYYVVAFDLATDHLLDRIDLGARHLKSCGGSTFTAEMNVSYVREVFQGAPLVFTTQLLGFDDKRLRYIHAMYHAEEGYLAATNECLSLYVDMESRRVAQIPAENRAKLAALAETHQSIEPPKTVGRSIATKGDWF